MSVNIVLRAAVLAAAAGIAAPSLAQNHVVITKTLVGSSAHKECLAVTERQAIRYWYRADAPIDFNIYTVQGKNTVYAFRRDKETMGSGSFAPKATGDYCMVWTNSSRKPVLFRVEFARLAR